MEYSRQETPHEEHILAFDPLLWQDAGPRQVGITAPGSSGGMRVADGDKLIVDQEFRKMGDMYHVATLRVINAKGEEELETCFARIGKLEDFPRLQEVVRDKKLTRAGYRQHLKVLPPTIMDYLK